MGQLRPNVALGAIGSKAPIPAVRQTATEPQALQRESQRGYSISSCDVRQPQCIPVQRSPRVWETGVRGNARHRAYCKRPRGDAAMRRFRRKARSPPVYFEFIQLIYHLRRVIFTGVCI